MGTLARTSGPGNRGASDRSGRLSPRRASAGRGGRGSRCWHAPVGYLVIAFPEEAEAGKARAGLLTGGYEEQEVMKFAPSEAETDRVSLSHAPAVVHRSS